MDLPQQFPYGPRLKTLLVFYSIGVLFCAAPLYWRGFWIFGVILGFLPLSVALAGTYRRFALRPCLAFNEDKLVVRRGGQAATEIAYSTIQKVQEARYGRMKVIKLQTPERSFEINSTLLPNDATFETIRAFLKTRVPSTEEKPKAISGAYLSNCSYEGMGGIYNSNAELLWRLKTLHFRKPHYPYGVIRIPDFVISDKDDKEIFRIKPERRWMPMARFVMTRDGVTICTIRLRNVVRTKYTLEFTNGEKWQFRTPLFSINFGGTSEKGEKIRTRFRSHNIWLMFFEPPHDRSELVCAIAFLHRERLRFN